MASLAANKLLLKALESGDFQTALQLLPKDIPPITIGPDGSSPLHYACRHGDAEMTRLLITQYKYSEKSTSKHGQTPVHVAAEYGHVETLRVLVESSALCEHGDVDTADIGISTTSAITTVRDGQGNTPLHTAAACGKLPVVQYLHRVLGCSPTCTNENKETPLHFAAKNGHVAVVKYLVAEAGCPLSPVDEHGRTPIHVAAGHGQLEVVRYLIEGKGCDPNTRTTEQWENSGMNIWPGRTLMHTACREGHLNVVQYLVNELKCDPSCRDEGSVTPLYLASQQGHMAVVKFLVCECQCDPTVTTKIYNGRSLLHAACLGGDLEVVQFLMEKQSNPGCGTFTRDKYSNTPIHLAALEGRLNVLEFCVVEKGCDPMVRGQFGRTPLHNASQEGHLAIVKYLINEHHVDPSCQDQDDNTPLHIASMSGHFEVVQFLVEKGCDPLTRNKYGNTPVHRAAMNGRTSVLEFFITETECDPMIRGQYGRTPLHHASLKGHLDIVKYLIKQKVDPTTRTSYGNSPMTLACRNACTEVAHYLYSKGEPLPKWYNTCNPLLDFRVKVYVVGNQSIGKSSLVKALSAEGIWFGGLRTVSDVTPETAGIDLVEFDSRLYGKVIFYDFAGHKEYYASHEIAFEASSHPTILLMVNVSEDDNDICKALGFWKQFLASAVLTSGCQAHVILVGSHTDQVLACDQEKKSSLLNEFPSSSTLTVLDVVLLDCRKPLSKGMIKLRQLLTMSCKNVRLQAEFDYQKGGILRNFVSKSLCGVVALVFSELFSIVLESSEAQLQPLKEVNTLHQTCESLNISGHLLILRSQDVPEDSWIILKKELILSQVHGLLKHLKHSTQQGIVPLSLLESQLRQHAPDLPPDLAIRYMKKLAFCSEVEPHALALLKRFPPETAHVNEKYYFFSSLINAEKPSHVWKPEQSFTYASGWHFKCMCQSRPFLYTMISSSDPD